MSMEGTGPVILCLYQKADRCRCHEEIAGIAVIKGKVTKNITNFTFCDYFHNYLDFIKDRITLHVFFSFKLI